MHYTTEDFIKKANQIHNFKYDYSKVEYASIKLPVIIICPEHGEFLQKPSGHLSGQGCRKCASVRRVAAYRELQKQGKGPWARESRQKAAKTCEDRFGSKTWAESEIGRKQASDRASNPDVRRKMSVAAKSETARKHYAETSKRNYGVEHWTKSDAGKAKLHALFSTDDERLARSQRMLSEEVRTKIEQTNLARYGTKYYWQSDEGRIRLKQLLNNDEVQKKIIQTKKLHGTINSSKAEKLAYEMLCNKFGKDDVESQYNDDERYPFNCDFYIKSLDLFIELNATWLHGFHWFDENDKNDLQRLEQLQEKSQLGKSLYERAIYIWTYDDLRKRKIAEDNNLNYLVFWDNDLSDFMKWYETV